MNHAAPDANIAEIRALAERLLSLACEPGTSEEPCRTAPLDGEFHDHSHTLSTIAREVYRARRMREKYLPARFFGEPAWDILLDLFINHCEGRPVSVTSSCMAAAAPSSTAFRWLAALEDESLIIRRPNPQDNRSSLIELTGAGKQKMVGHLQWIAGSMAKHTPQVAP